MIVFLLVCFLLLNLVRFAGIILAPAQLLEPLDPGWLWWSPYFLVALFLVMVFVVPFGLAY